LPNNGSSINWTQSDRFVSAGRGLLHEYDSAGFVKVVDLNMTKKHFFRDMFVEEVINQNWLTMKSTLVIIF